MLNHHKNIPVGAHFQAYKSSVKDSKNTHQTAHMYVIWYNTNKSTKRPKPNTGKHFSIPE